MHRNGGGVSRKPPTISLIKSSRRKPTSNAGLIGASGPSVTSLSTNMTSVATPNVPGILTNAAKASRQAITAERITGGSVATDGPRCSIQLGGRTRHHVLPLRRIAGDGVGQILRRAAGRFV